ncbi:MAG: N-6 DNA methylase [Actinobacteria bacterium]|nr:N-6 DNA methylase [Actinomycetota bacterium]
MALVNGSSYLAPLQKFVESLTNTYGSATRGQPEDQLKPPVVEFLRECGAAMNSNVSSKLESAVEGIGRPDVAVDTDGLLCGYVELKAPGTGANTSRFKGHNKEQWKKFASLPNLVYTDGNEWILYRTGERKARVALSGDVSSDGRSAVDADDAEKLSVLLRDFFSWDPIVPDTPKKLAEMLAPLCHLVRDDVLRALEDETSALSLLAAQWRDNLFSDADDAQFTDAYAQTLTYSLLLARFSGEEDLSTESAADALQSGHGLLAQTLRVLGDPQAREEISLGVGLLQRSIEAVDPTAVSKKNADPWLYFYEDFLAAYDKALRNDRGVYYTPVEVVNAQVRLVSDLLVNKLGKTLSFAEKDVVLLDPAAGTGTYPLAALQHGLDRIGGEYGPGMVAGYATEMAKNIHSFEILVGPYAVAHLRLSERIMEAGGSLPDDGVHVYLTDTLESPNASPPGQLMLNSRMLAREHERAMGVKRDAKVLVCIGNPPYDLQRVDPEQAGITRKGGWVRKGDHGPETAILQDFLRPAREAGTGGHLKVLYNDYVYFWRWALWKIFEKQQGPGVVSFITSASYLRGPGFVGMREVMRRTFDELWILDLEGDSLGARKTQNIFAIRTPVAIAVGIRYGGLNPDTPARVRYAKLEGTREAKLATLDSITGFEDINWKQCFSGWQNPFLPEREGDYFSWPPLTDIFPWQHSGVQLKRKWPIGETPELLKERWEALLSTSDPRAAFRETDRKIDRNYLSLDEPHTRLSTLAESIKASAPTPERVRYGYRSFDRQWLLKDVRLGDRMRPELWQAHGDRQVYMTSVLAVVLGLGPAATAASELPDLNHFHGRGGKDVIPLWRDAAATEPNVAGGLLEMLLGAYGEPISAKDLFAYAYALLSMPAYVESFSEELSLPGPRLPITRDAELFREAANLGRKLVNLHTYGERFGESGVPHGQAKVSKAIPDAPEGYPEEHAYDPAGRTLRVGEGELGPVSPEVWEFEVSGLRVVKSWLDYRMKKPAGRTSSPLDEIRPERWTIEMTHELLELLWVLEATVAEKPYGADLLARIVESELFEADELPEPSEEERKPPK